MKKLFIGLFVLLGLFALAACNQDSEPAAPSINDGEFDQNEETYIPDIKMYVIGGYWNSWNPETIADANPSCTFVKDENSAGLDTKYTYSVVITDAMVAENENGVEFKFLGTNSWSVQFGMEDVDFDKCNAAFLALFEDQNGDGKVDNADKAEIYTGPTTNRTGYRAKVAGTYVIEYYPYNFESNQTDVTTYTCKLVVNFTPAA